MTEVMVSWPDKAANLVACTALNLDPDTHSIFFMSWTAVQYVDDDLLNKIVEDYNDYFNQPVEEIMRAVHNVKLPKGFAMVGVQRIDGTGPEHYAVVDFREVAR